MRTNLIFWVFLLCSTTTGAAGTRVVDYQRHEYQAPTEQRSAVLSVFVYDVPYFGACGVFPPFHIANHIFRSGGSTGGMSPGATWEPFQVSGAEYGALVREVAELEPETLDGEARYTAAKFVFDHNFDQILEWDDWTQAVCGKHRDTYLRGHSGH